MTAREYPRASLRVKDQGGGPKFYGRWRDPSAGPNADKSVERPIGPAWVVREGEPGARPNGQMVGKWRDRRGRPEGDALTVSDAWGKLPEVQRAWTQEAEAKEEAKRIERDRAVTFADVAAEWRRLRRDAKPSHLADIRSLLAPVPAEGEPHREARIMRAFGHRPVTDITPSDVRDFLDGLEEDHDLEPRTVNKHRGVLWSVFDLAMKPAERDRDQLRVGGGFGVEMDNPVTDDTKRAQPRPGRLEVWRPEEIHALARAAESGPHRQSEPRGLVDLWARRREDHQDGVLYTVAAFAGLRRGELLALRWRDVDFEARRITVVENYSHGVVTSPKSGITRTVPLADQAAEALERLSRRLDGPAGEPWFVGEDDLVFCNRTGGHLDASALRRRYVAAREAAGLRPLRFHALRHCFGSLAAQTSQLQNVQAWMGHADIKTTMIYAHYVPAHDEADRLSRALTSRTAETLVAA
jgi:integrase